MEKFSKIEVEMQQDVGILRLNEPDKLNAISLVMLEEIDCAIRHLAGSARALIVTGAGRAFCSGASLDGGLGDVDPDPAKRDLGFVLETHINPLMSAFRKLPIPWISAVRGAAAGFGASLALAADMVIASETAYFLQAFSRLGLTPDGGATYLLVSTIGRARAMELMLLGDRLPAQRACEWGLVNRVVADASLMDEAMLLARRLASGPTVALGLMRKATWDALDADWEGALKIEREIQRTAGRTADYDEGLAAFGEKRKAVFSGR